MAETSIFESFVSSQGFVLFEAVGEGEFKVMGGWPEWCGKMWGDAPAGGSGGGDGGTIRLGDKSAFLENFLYEAEELWKVGGAGPVSSGNWIEAGESGEAIPLEATAMTVAGRWILTVRNLGAAYSQQQEMYQTARDSLLSHEKLLREILKKEILLHCIVHDLSQPLSAMAGTFHLLGTEHLSPEVKRYVKSGEREAQRQEMMIRGILEAFSSDLAAQQAVNTEPHEAPDIVRSAQATIEAFENAFRDRGIMLRLDPSVRVKADWRVTGEASRLERIFGNLLENAVRYSPKGSSVTIGIEDDGEFVRASVNDEGPGLPKDKPQTQLFQLFARGKAHAGKAGLGLYFCKITVERWGGTIGAETRSEGGSRFWFRLPRATSADIAASAVSDAARVEPVEKEPVRSGKAHATPLRILVADDAEMNRELLMELLAKQGHTVTGVADGAAAIRALDSGTFDAVVMDEEMPGMTGVEATRAIRAREKGGTKHQFIIGLTGNSLAEDERRLLEAGMDAFLTKPVNLQKLYQTVALGSLKSDTTAAGGAGGVSVTPVPDAPMAVNVVTSHALAAGTPRVANDGALDVRAQLDKMTGGSEKLARRLVDAFLKDAPKTIAQIRAALKAGKAEQMASAAHLFKGAVGIFGAPRAVAAARNLQTLGRAGKLSGAKEELRDLEAGYEELVGELRALYSDAVISPRVTAHSDSSGRKIKPRLTPKNKR
jgi:signal transduction histidine kinase/HPt (histidine-containing phosphotransfer) domain-containing protein/ActR/RegA family two-component response regulator